MELRIPTLEQLRFIYERDMKPAFPPQELRPLRTMEALWVEGEYTPWCLFDGEEIVGQCFLWLGSPGWALMDYLCVSQEHRNGGLGSLLLKKVLEKEPDTIIFGESEAPVHAPDAAMAERRLGFYVRNHARLAGYDADVFGAHYKIFYWAKRPVADEDLIRQHQSIYQSRFTPENYSRHVVIPRDPAAPPYPQLPWSE